MPHVTNASILAMLEKIEQRWNVGNFAMVESLCWQVLALDARQPRALHMLGRLARRSGRLDIALQLLQQSVQLDARDAQAQFDLADACMASGHIQQAIATYRAAIKARPDFAEAHANLGVALALTAQFNDSITVLRHAIALKPDLANAHDTLGTSLRQTDQVELAIAEHQKSIELQPSFAASYFNLGLDFSELGRSEEAVDAFRRAATTAPTYKDAHTSLVYEMHFSSQCDPKAIYEEHRRWNRTFAQPLTPRKPSHSNERDPQRPLRIGYVSPDFREHSVSYFIENLLAGHDPHRFEVFCYANIVKADPVTHRLHKSVKNWRDVTRSSNDDVYRMIQQDQIDILVDLAGHTGGNRLLLFARRPAPIQVTYLGYIGSTGLDAIDYRITDAIADPPGTTEQFHSEQLLRLPHTFACYRPPSDAPPVAPLPALSNGHVTFASFTTVQKINPPLLDCWAELLSRLPESRLIIGARGLRHASLQQSIRQIFDRRGIHSNRLTLLDHQTLPEYLATHHQVDVLLDTFPVNGHTVTCHALWMGVVPVSLAGSTYCQRLGASVMSNLGLIDLVAQTPEEYTDIAMKLANDLLRLADLRGSMRQRMASCPLLDTLAFTQNIEATYRDIWRSWCTRLAK